MRLTWKRTWIGLLFFGIAGGAALGLNEPALIPHSDADQVPESPEIPIIPAVAKVDPLLLRVQAVEPTPRLDPSVALDWSGPSELKVNTAADYTLSVRNTSGQMLQKVVVQVKLPGTTNVKATRPEGKIVEGIYLWELGNLEPKTSKEITLNLIQSQRGELNAQAWVTFTGTAGMKVAVREPKLEIRMKAPAQVVLGDKYPLEYTVSNVGDYLAEDVRVGLRGVKASLGRTLKPGEQFTLQDTMIATPGGTLVHEAVATAQGNLNASTRAEVQVLVPKITLSMTGPEELLIGRKGTYTLNVRNSGDIAVTNIVIRENVPASFRVLAADHQGVVSTNNDVVSWTMPELAPGKEMQVSFHAVGTQPGTVTHSASVAGNRGTAATADTRTKIVGIPALRMEMIDLLDPVEKGQDTTYEVKITNTGSQSDADLRVVCQLPESMTFKSASGPVTHTINAKGEVVFDLIRELAPKTEAVLRVTVTTQKPGDLRFKAILTSKHLTREVLKEESTRVFGE